MPVPPRPSRLNHWLLLTLASVLCAACLGYLAVRHLIWPRLSDWRPEIVAYMERAIGRPLVIGALRPGWQGLHPTLQLDQVRLDGQDGLPRLQAESIRLRLSWRSVLQGAPRLAELHLQAPRVKFERLANGRMQLAGFLLPDDGKINEPLLNWLMSQGELSARGATIVLHDARRAWPDRELSALSLDLRNQGRHHEFSARSDHPLTGNATASLALAFDRPAFSRRPDWRQWDGELHLSMHGVQLEPLVQIVAGLSRPLSRARFSAQGVMDEMFWLRFRDGRIQDTRLKFAAARPAVAWQRGRASLKALEGEGELHASATGGYELTLERAVLTDASGVLLSGRGTARFDGSQVPVAQRLQLEVAPFEVAPVLAFAKRLPLPDAVARMVRPIDLRGRLSEVALDWHAAGGAKAAGEPAPWTVRADFERLSMQVDRSMSPALPEFSNISGSLQAKPAQGSVKLQGQGALVSLPRVFVEPDLPLDQLRAELQWSKEVVRGNTVWQVHVPNLEVANADVRGQFAGHWRREAAGPGHLQLTGRFDRVQAPRVARYLPLGIPSRTREWVARSLREGVGEDLVVEVEGDLKDFPFRDPARGRFRIAGRLRDATLAFSPQWPEIDQIQADLDFSRGGFSIQAHSAMTGNVMLSEVRARIAEYREPLLLIDGRGVGMAADMLQFVDDSPLQGTVSRHTRDLHVTGEAKLGLSLWLPLAQLSATKVQGSVDFSGNEVRVDHTLPPFTNVTGRLGFSEAGIELSGLQGQLLGGPIRVDGQADPSGRLRLSAQGSIDAQGMRRLIDNPLTRRLEGRARYTAKVDVEGRASTLTLESDLVGLSSALPAPFTKAADELWPLRVVSEPRAPAALDARPMGDKLDVRLRDRIALVLERERDPGTERLLIRRAGFAVGDEPVLRDAGLSVLVRTPELDFDAWRALLTDGELERMQRDAGDAVVPGMALVPDLVSVVADDLRIGGRELHEVVLGASRGEGRWSANIAAREIVGHFNWLDARPGERIGTLTARFDRLELPRSREGELESVLSGAPEQLPALEVSVEELVLGRVPVGRMTLSAANEGTVEQPVWRLHQLRIDNPQARLDADGAWSFRSPGATGSATAMEAGQQPGRTTSLNLELSVRDTGGLLERVGIRDALQGGQGRLDGRVNWNGSPLAIDLPTLEGDLRLDLADGAFLRIDPGPARLIAVLNLQSLQRLLRGDLNRVFGQGFAFDAIGGDIRIASGIARTDALQMSGAQAQVTLSGMADLKRETQDLHVHVTPELDAGLASIAVGAMFNPIVGIGSLAAQYVLRKPLQDALGFDVEITGSWSDPMVSERTRRPPAAPDLRMLP
jgi:uncharacterized protein (TIGR02099 family)